MDLFNQYWLFPVVVLLLWLCGTVLIVGSIIALRRLWRRDLEDAVRRTMGGW